MADAPKNDTQVGRLAVDSKLITLAELNACIEERQALALAGKRVSLTEVMIKSGYVTRSQLQRVGGDIGGSVPMPRILTIRLLSITRHGDGLL